MIEIKGDILTNIDNQQRTLILHGCNCLHKMGAGIALYLKKNYPSIAGVDLNTQYASTSKLGTFSKAVINDNLIIANLYTQFYPGPDARLKHITNALKAVHAEFGDDIEYRSPRIGCGYGGLKWEVSVRKVFEKENFSNIKIYYLHGVNYD